VGAPAAPAEQPLSTPPRQRRATPRARPAHGITPTGRPSATGPPTLGPGRDTPPPLPSCRRPAQRPSATAGAARDRRRPPARQRPLQAAGGPPRHGPQGVDQAVPPVWHPRVRHPRRGRTPCPPPWHTDGGTHTVRHKPRNTAPRGHRQQEGHMPDPGGYRDNEDPGQDQQRSPRARLRTPPQPRAHAPQSHRRHAVSTWRRHRRRPRLHLPPRRLCAPMYRHPALNPDGLPLTSDHSIGRSRGGLKADRLMLAAYNRSRGAGDRGDRYAAPWWARE
jgi:hypothetical protein